MIEPRFIIHVMQEEDFTHLSRINFREYDDICDVKMDMMTIFHVRRFKDIKKYNLWVANFGGLDVSAYEKIEDLWKAYEIITSVDADKLEPFLIY
ncbi:MAG: hypothetical protein RR088_04225, partial [Clostridia bacterium]